MHTKRIALPATGLLATLLFSPRGAGGGVAKSHPRIYVTPKTLVGVRTRCKGAMKETFESMRVAPVLEGKTQYGVGDTLLPYPPTTNSMRHSRRTPALTGGKSAPFPIPSGCAHNTNNGVVLLYLPPFGSTGLVLSAGVHGMRYASMAATRKTAKESESKWASLTWDDLNQWAGTRSVSRGRSYQRQGRVEALGITPEGELLATVAGGQRYVVLVSFESQSSGSEHSPHSKCTCPVGFDCKHGVAAVVEALEVMADGGTVPPVDGADPRLDVLVREHDVESAQWSYSREDETDSIWDQRIREHIRSHDADELVELVWSLTQRYPELYEEFRERIQLDRGDVADLVADAARQIAEVTSESAWSNRWTGEGHTPDYAPIRRRLERLSEMGYADEVASLGRELIARGIEQIEQSHDNGDTAMALATCLEIVFGAVVRSGLSGPEQLLYGIDARLLDDYGILDTSADVIFDAGHSPAEWSQVADKLQARLDAEQAKHAKSAAEDGTDSFSRKYHRDQLTGWLLRALEEGRRTDKVREIYEREARLTGSYERLLRYLIDEKCYDDAETWGREGIEKTHERWPGIASQLGLTLGGLARRRRQWKIAAAYSAWRFFDSPGVETFNELIRSAGKARCKASVRKQAIRFLETGQCPIRPGATKHGAAELQVDPDWPLPAPDTMQWLLLRKQRRQARPYHDVLVDLAIAEKRHEDVLRWYDRLCEAAGRSSRFGTYYDPSSLADRVADAVARSHPERALEIYERAVESLLPSADRRAYERIGAYLRKMRPVFKAIGREDDWHKHVKSLREEYRRRPRFIDVLDTLDNRTILQAKAKSKLSGGRSRR